MRLKFFLLSAHPFLLLLKLALPFLDLLQAIPVLGLDSLQTVRGRGLLHFLLHLPVCPPLLVCPVILRLTEWHRHETRRD